MFRKQDLSRQFGTAMDPDDVEYPEDMLDSGGDDQKLRLTKQKRRSEFRKKCLMTTNEYNLFRAYKSENAKKSKYRRAHQDLSQNDEGSLQSSSVFIKKADIADRKARLHRQLLELQKAEARLDRQSDVPPEFVELVDGQLRSLDLTGTSGSIPTLPDIPYEFPSNTRHKLEELPTSLGVQKNAVQSLSHLTPVIEEDDADFADQQQIAEELSPTSNCDTLTPSQIMSSTSASGFETSEMEAEPTTFGSADQHVELIDSRLRGDPTNPDTSPFVAGVRRYLHTDTPVVTWENGWKTILPFVPDDKGNNILSNDEDRVKFAAEQPCGPGNSKPFKRIVVLSPDDYTKFGRSKRGQAEFRAYIRDLLSQDKLVVCQKYYLKEAIGFNAEDMADVFGLELNQASQPWDAVRRATQHDNPYLDLTSIKQFFDPEELEDPRKITCIMDTKVDSFGPPPGFELLNEAYSKGLSLTAIAYPDMPNASNDFHNVCRLWLLLHKCGFFTFAHKDANGFGTLVDVENGAKAWTAIWPKSNLAGLSRTELKQKIRNVIAGGTLEELREFAEAETYIALPGDIIIQPPGFLHQVLTLSNCATTGVHFLNLNSMHLTEFSRWYDHSDSILSTNMDHSSIYFIVRRMMIGYPFQNDNTVFYRRALLAHCLMILDPDQYVSQDARQAKTSKGKGKRTGEDMIEDDEQGHALKVVVAICSFLKIAATSSKVRAGLFPKGFDYSDRGAQVTGLVPALSGLIPRKDMAVVEDTAPRRSVRHKGN